MLLSFTGAKKENDSSVPAYVVWILLGCIGGVVVLASVIIIVVCVRRRRPDKRTDSEQPNDESVSYITSLCLCIALVHDRNSSSRQTICMRVEHGGWGCRGGGTCPLPPLPPASQKIGEKHIFLANILWIRAFIRQMSCKIWEFCYFFRSSIVKFGHFVRWPFVFPTKTRKFLNFITCSLWKMRI